MAPRVELHKSQISLALYSLLAGTLSSTPFLWCFIFGVLFSYDYFETWQSVLYTWSIVAINAIIFFSCFIPKNIPLKRYLGFLCAFNILVTFSSILCWNFSILPEYAVPALFIANAVTLAWWVRAAADAVYICPDIYQKWYELGILLATVIYYMLIICNIYKTSVFMLPFTVFLVGGFFSLRQIQHHSVYHVGLERCLAIFTSGNTKKYVVYGFSTVTCMIKNELFIFVWLTIGCIGGVCSLGLLTSVFKGMKSYLYIFCFGQICCGGAMIFRNYVMTIIYTVISYALLLCIHIFYAELPNYIVTVLITFYFFAHFNSTASVLYSMQHKLSRCINMPRIIIALVMFCNILIAVTVLTLNKINK